MTDPIEKLPSPDRIVALADEYGPQADVPVMSGGDLPWGDGTYCQVQTRTVGEYAIETLRRQHHQESLDHAIAAQLLDGIRRALSVRESTMVDWEKVLVEAASRAKYQLDVARRRREEIER